MLSFTPLLFFASLSIASPISPEAANAGAGAAVAPVAQAVSPSSQGKPSSEGVSTFDGQSLAAIPAAPAVAQVQAAGISQAGWTITADSEQDGNPATNAINGNNNDFWHTEYTPDLSQLPHTITIDTKASNLIGSITYLPRQDGSFNGNWGQHVIQIR